MNPRSLPLLYPRALLATAILFMAVLCATRADQLFASGVEHAYISLPPTEEFPTLDDMELNFRSSLNVDRFRYVPPDDWSMTWDGLGRGYYVNDQRVEFTGLEATFGVEGIAAGAFYQRAGDWVFSARGELYLNQPFDRNVLIDNPERVSYAPNFDIEPFQISQMIFTARRWGMLLAVGKMNTPFGRTYYPVFANDLQDAPFIRAEAIKPRETGAMLQVEPGIWVISAAVTNGDTERDTNSSKALCGRMGIDLASFSCGASIKWQDGTGSEHQKMFNRNVGVDMMVRRGRWILSGEAIYDEYGLRRPGLALDDITWGRSIYYRDLNSGQMHVPIRGCGYYVNLGLDLDRWYFMLNYGDYFPEQIGDPRHDAANHRGIFKAVYRPGEHWALYTSVLIENDLPHAQSDRTRHGSVLWSGVQASF